MKKEIQTVKFHTQNCQSHCFEAISKSTTKKLSLIFTSNQKNNTTNPLRFTKKQRTKKI